MGLLKKDKSDVIKLIKKYYNGNLVYNEEFITDIDSLVDSIQIEVKRLDEEIEQKKGGDKLKKSFYRILKLLQIKKLQLERSLINSALSVEKNPSNYGKKSIESKAKMVAKISKLIADLKMLDNDIYYENPFLDDYYELYSIVIYLNLVTYQGEKSKIELLEDKTIIELLREPFKLLQKLETQISEDIKAEYTPQLESAKKSKQDLKSVYYQSEKELIEDLDKLFEQFKTALNRNSNPVIDGKTKQADGLNLIVELENLPLTGDIRVKKLIEDAQSVGIFSFTNPALDVNLVKDITNKLQIIKLLSNYILKINNQMKKSISVDGKTYSTESIIESLDKLYEYLKKLEEELTATLEATKLDEYEELIESKKKLEKSSKDMATDISDYVTSKNPKERKVAARDYVEADEAYKEAVSRKNNDEEELGIEQKIENVVLVDNENQRKKYKATVEERSILRNEYYTSGSIKEMSFAEFLYAKGATELGDLEKYIEELKKYIYEEYTKSESELSFIEYVKSNSSMVQLLKDFVTDYELMEYDKKMKLEMENVTKK